MNPVEFTVRFATYRAEDDIGQDGDFFVVSADFPILVTGKGDEEYAKMRGRAAVDALLDYVREDPERDMGAYLSAHGVTPPVVGMKGWQADTHLVTAHA